MTKTRFLSTPSTALRTSLSLLAVISTACAPTAPPARSDVALAPSSTPFVPEQPTLEPARQGQASTEALPATPFPVATSRGPNLEATDPTTVSLASGQIQFIEFFRFT